MSPRHPPMDLCPPSPPSPAQHWSPRPHLRHRPRLRLRHRRVLSAGTSGRERTVRMDGTPRTGIHPLSQVPHHPRPVTMVNGPSRLPPIGPPLAARRIGGHLRRLVRPSQVPVHLLAASWTAAVEPVRVPVQVLVVEGASRKADNRPVLLLPRQVKPLRRPPLRLLLDPSPHRTT